MLGKSDRVNFVITNFKDVEGNICNSILKLPCEDELNIGDNIVEASLFEYQEGYLIGGFSPLRILIGNKISVSDLVKKIKNEHIDYKITGKLDYIRSNDVCYIKDGEKYLIYREVLDNDIVVNNKEEFINKIMEISNEVSKIDSGIKNIKKMIR